MNSCITLTKNHLMPPRSTKPKDEDPCLNSPSNRTLHQVEPPRRERSSNYKRLWAHSPVWQSHHFAVHIATFTEQKGRENYRT